MAEYIRNTLVFLFKLQALLGRSLDGSGWSLFNNKSPMQGLSQRLTRRKQLIARRRLSVDIAALLAAVGVLVMMAEAELFLNVRHNFNAPSRKAPLCCTVKAL